MTVTSTKAWQELAYIQLTIQGLALMCRDTRAERADAAPIQELLPYLAKELERLAGEVYGLGDAYEVNWSDPLPGFDP